MLLSKLLSLLPVLSVAFAQPSGSHDLTERGDKHKDPSKGVPSGFVTTNGKQFWLDGNPFCFAGMNAYWIPQLVKESQYDAAFSMLKDLNVRVLRTWAFSMVEQLPSSNLTYYQYWDDKGHHFLNLGASGLARLDTTMRYAEKYGIKVILTFTNNWNDYGGMDMYLNHTLGTDQYHSDFYVHQPTIDAYETYVQEIVRRYKDSPAVFAWELANEPRANGYPSIARPDFKPAQLTTWIENRAQFVKSLDPNHMVAIGDEGYYNWPNSDDYIYNGASGLDFDANLKLKDIDFGTFHLYPQSWNKTPEWGLEYIQQHISSQNKIGKPVVFEEFNLEGYDLAMKILPQWTKKAQEGGIPGIIVWGLGAQNMDTSDTTVYYNGNVGSWDGMDIYPDKKAEWAYLKELGKAMNAKCPIKR